MTDEKIIPQMTASEIADERDHMGLPFTHDGCFITNGSKSAHISICGLSGDRWIIRDRLTEYELAAFVLRAVNAHHDLLTRVAELEGENAGLNELHGKVFREKVAATATIEQLRAELATLREELENRLTDRSHIVAAISDHDHHKKRADVLTLQIKAQDMEKQHLRDEVSVLNVRVLRLQAELSTLRAVQPEAVKTMRPMTNSDGRPKDGDILKWLEAGDGLEYVSRADGGSVEVSE